MSYFGRESSSLLDIILSYQPPSTLSFNVPVRAEGLPGAESFAVYAGDVLTAADLSQAAPLQRTVPAGGPPVPGEQLTVADTLADPPPGDGRYYVAAVRHGDQIRAGRSMIGGVLREETVLRYGVVHRATSQNTLAMIKRFLSMLRRPTPSEATRRVSSADKVSATVASVESARTIETAPSPIVAPLSSNEAVRLIRALPLERTSSYVLKIESILKAASFFEETWVSWGHGRITRRKPGPVWELNECEEVVLNEERAWQVGWVCAFQRWGFIFGKPLQEQWLSENDAALRQAGSHLEDLMKLIINKLESNATVRQRHPFPDLWNPM